MRFDDGAIEERVAEATRTVREFAGSAPNQQMLALLDAMADSYALSLLTVSADELLFRQAALKQVMALASVLRGDEMSHPVI